MAARAEQISGLGGWTRVSGREMGEVDGEEAAKPG